MYGLHLSLSHTLSLSLSLSLSLPPSLWLFLQSGYLSSFHFPYLKFHSSDVVIAYKGRDGCMAMFIQLVLDIQRSRVVQKSHLTLKAIQVW